MEVLILPTAEDLAREGAARIADLVRSRPDSVLGVATGSSPQGIYQRLAQQVRDGSLSFAEASAFALDEYVGLPREHPQSYAEVIRRTVTEPLQLNPQRVHVPDGRASDLAAAARAYESSIEDAGGIDLQLLGIGGNGHIGFNEPVSSMASRTRVKTLTPRTRQDNARFFADESQVPVHCLTMGLGTILQARRLLLVAQGRGKASAVAAAVEGPLTAMVPASALQLHPHATVLLDEDAASKLQLRDYYRFAQEHAGEVG